MSSAAVKFEPLKKEEIRNTGVVLIPAGQSDFSL
jgi:hypothetical protein